jgi:hypothetical protein
MYQVHEFYISDSDAQKVANATGKVSVKLYTVEHKGYHRAPFNLTVSQVKKIEKSKKNAHSITLSHAQVKSLFKKTKSGDDQEGGQIGLGWWSEFKRGFKMPFKFLADGARYLEKPITGAMAAGISAVQPELAPVSPLLASGAFKASDYILKQAGLGLILDNECPMMPDRTRKKYKKQLQEIDRGLGLYRQSGKGLSSSNKHFGSGLTTSNKAGRRQRGGNVNFKSNELF